MRPRAEMRRRACRRPLLCSLGRSASMSTSIEAPWRRLRWALETATKSLMMADGSTSESSAIAPLVTAIKTAMKEKARNMYVPYRSDVDRSISAFPEVHWNGRLAGYQPALLYGDSDWLLDVLRLLAGGEDHEAEAASLSAGW